MAATKFTPENRAALIECFRLGMGVAAAARAVGLNEGTVKGWLTRGRKQPDSESGVFAAEVDKAREAGRALAPMSEDELIRVVSEAARKGSVQAMKLRWEMLNGKRPVEQAEPAAEPKFDPLAGMDELAERRSLRA